MADFYEAAAGRSRPEGPARWKYYKDVSNWMLGDLSRLLNLQNLDIAESPLSAEHLVELIELVDTGAVSVSLAKTVLEEAFQSGHSPARIVEEKQYTQISDSGAIESAVREVLESNPKAVDDYLDGKESAARYLVGQVMKSTRGQAKPDLVNQLVAESLEALKQSEG